MDYIVYDTLRAQALCGPVCLERGTKCTTIGKLIVYKSQPICLVTSEIAHTHLACNDDGCGLQRGQLITQIKSLLQADIQTKQKRKYKRRWKLIWGDSSLQKYRRIEHADYWLWNHDFYNAPISDLEYILNLIS